MESPNFQNFCERHHYWDNRKFPSECNITIYTQGLIQCLNTMLMMFIYLFTCLLPNIHVKLYTMVFLLCCINLILFISRVTNYLTSGVNGLNVR